MWYTVLFCVGICIVSLITSVICLNKVRFATGRTGTVGAKAEEDKEDAVTASQTVSLPVKSALALVVFPPQKVVLFTLCLALI